MTSLSLVADTGDKSAASTTRVQSILRPTWRQFIQIGSLRNTLTVMAEQEVIEQLKRSANDARARAYCPYSNFRVGAALLCKDGSIIEGVNVENASYGLTVCAERVAIMSAVAAGHTQFIAMAICCDIKSEFKASCGACRQVLYEFGEDLDIYLVKPDMTSLKVNLRDLVPMAFGPAALKEERDG